MGPVSKTSMKTDSRTLTLLKTFREPRMIDSWPLLSENDWRLLLEEDPKQVIRWFIDAKLIVPEQLNFQLNNMGIDHLRDLLKRSNLPIKCSKAEMINRLNHIDEENLWHEIGTKCFYVCSEESNIVLRKWKNKIIEDHTFMKKSLAVVSNEFRVLVLLVLTETLSQEIIKRVVDPAGIAVEELFKYIQKSTIPEVRTAISNIGKRSVFMGNSPVNGFSPLGFIFYVLKTHQHEFISPHILNNSDSVSLLIEDMILACILAGSILPHNVRQGDILFNLDKDHLECSKVAICIDDHTAIEAPLPCKKLGSSWVQECLLTDYTKPSKHHVFHANRPIGGRLGMKFNIEIAKNLLDHLHGFPVRDEVNRPVFIPDDVFELLSHNYRIITTQGSSGSRSLRLIEDVAKVAGCPRSE